MARQSGKYVVLRVQNDHGAMTVRDPSRNSTFHVVECEDEAFEDVLDELDRADVVRLDIRRIGCRGDAWCVEDGARLEAGTDPVVDDPLAEEVDPIGESAPAGEEDTAPEGEEADPIADCGGSEATGTVTAIPSAAAMPADAPARRRPAACGGSSSTRGSEMTSGIEPVPTRSTATP